MVERSITTRLMADLSGTRALVTGGTSGIGRAIAAALAAAGARVVLTGRDPARAQAVAGELGAPAFGLRLDVRDESSVQQCVETAYERLGGLELLVCNAGIGMRTVNPRFLTDPQPFWEVTPNGFRDVVETKLAGTFLTARAVVPRMLAAGGGSIIVVSMSQATMTRRGFVPYGPSGAGVEALARVMAADLADSPIRVNIVLPGGATSTAMVPDDAPSEIRGRLLDPAVMGPPVVWLASEAGRRAHDRLIVAKDFTPPEETGGDR